MDTAAAEEKNQLQTFEQRLFIMKPSKYQSNKYLTFFSLILTWSYILCGFQWINQLFILIIYRVIHGPFFKTQFQCHTLHMPFIFLIENSYNTLNIRYCM